MGPGGIDEVSIAYALFMGVTLPHFFLFAILLAWSWLVLLMPRWRPTAEMARPGLCAILPFPSGPGVGVLLPLVSRSGGSSARLDAVFNWGDPMENIPATGSPDFSMVPNRWLRRMRRMRCALGALSLVTLVLSPVAYGTVFWIFYLASKHEVGVDRGPVFMAIVTVSAIFVFVGSAFMEFITVRETLASPGLLFVNREGDRLLLHERSGETHSCSIASLEVKAPSKDCATGLGHFLWAAFSAGRWLPCLRIRDGDRQIVVPSAVPGAPNILSAMMSGRQAWGGPMREKGSAPDISA